MLSCSCYLSFSVELLVNMLAMEGEGSRAEFASLEAELSSKARREFIKVKGKARLVAMICAQVN